MARRATKPAAAPSEPVVGPWPLPEGWRWERLGQLGTWSGGGTPSKSNPAFWDNGSIPWVSPKDMKRLRIDSTEDMITRAAIAGSSAKMLEAGAVMCVMRSGILRHTFPVAVNDVAVTMNQDMRALRVRDDVLPDFVAHYLRARSNHILEIAMKGGTTVNSLEAARLDALTVPLPPMVVQRRIVARIDELLTELDDAAETLARARADLGVWRKALLKAAVTGELTAGWRAANPPVETGADLLARILASRRWSDDPKNRGKRHVEPARLDMADLPILPEGWVWATLPQLGDFGRGKSKHRPRNDPKLYEGSFPFVQTGEVANCSGKVLSYRQTYSDFGLAQSKLWPTGTLCITIAANIAKTGVLTFDACFPDSIVGLATAEGVRSDYVELVIRTLQAGLEADAPATAQRNINVETLEALPIPLPSLAEQVEIVRQFDEAEVAWELLMRDEIDRDAATLRQSILAAAFRGDLVQ